MSQELSSPDRVSKRCLRACTRCRDMKVRCSGTFPCARCSRKREACVYKTDGGRVTVLQSYLESLEQRVASMDNFATGSAVQPKPVEDLPAPGITPPRSTIESNQSSGKGTATSGISSGFRASELEGAPPTVYGGDLPHHYHSAASPSEDFSHNPLVRSNGAFATDPQGKYWYMGPTSSWAFCRRILGIIGTQISEEAPIIKPWAQESIALKWNPIALDEPPEVDNLPSFDYAALLLSTVKYHLGSLYEIIDHDTFYRNMEIFYRDPAKESQRSRFWYAQFLFVLAFGEAFISIGSIKSVAGLNYASRGLSLLPCFIPLQNNSLVAVEALCLAALYLQSLDSRLLAFQLIGQALRVCVVEGWHRHMSALEVTSSHAKRCTTLFWTTYMIDRDFGTLIGAPSSIRDEDITVNLRNEWQSDPGKADALVLQVQMARLTAMILSGVYGVDRTSNGALLANTRSALHGIALVEKELASFLDTRFIGMDIRTSKIATSLTLSYHHCVVLATRPLVMCILHKSFAKGGCSVEIHEGPVSSMLQSCTCSALNILRILKALGNSNMIDHFLSFQLETAFSSAIVLYVISELLPGFLADGSWLQAVHEIFEIMIMKGSLAAPLRSREFQHLRQSMGLYMRKSSDRTTSSPPEEFEPIQETQSRLSGGAARSSVETFASWGPLEHHSDFTLSSVDILSMADSLQADDFLVQD